MAQDGERRRVAAETNGRRSQGQGALAFLGGIVGKLVDSTLCVAPSSERDRKYVVRIAD